MQFVTKERDNGLETGVALLAAFARWSRASTSNRWARIGRKHPRLPFGNEEANRIQRGRRGCTAPHRAKTHLLQSCDCTSENRYAQLSHDETERSSPAFIETMGSRLLSRPSEISAMLVARA